MESIWGSDCVIDLRLRECGVMMIHGNVTVKFLLHHEQTVCEVLRV
jgi:hypothetical protein